MLRDLDRKKMVFLSGPRQCGKTTVVRRIVADRGGEYLSWDDPAARRRLQRTELNPDSPLWAFDELHKFRRWRNYLKGLFDLHGTAHEILVTGSARLDLYGRGGDSLQGRYYPHRLHPFTASEIGNRPLVPVDQIPALPNSPGAVADLETMLVLGGFPEPFLAGSEKEGRRWRLAYGARLVEEEVRVLEQVKEIERVEFLFDRLDSVAGSCLSINSLREDLEVAFETVRKWLAILEKLCAIFRISPFGPPRIKAVKKEQKLYFWDWARAESEGARFENLLAMHLLRLVHWCQDVEGEKAELQYFRTRMGHELDFLILRRGRPWMAVEAKLSDEPLAPGLRYALERIAIPWAFQVSLRPGREKRFPDIGKTCVRAVSAARFLANLP